MTEYKDKAMYPAEPSHAAAAGPDVRLVWATPDPLGAIAVACRMYEGKPAASLDAIDDDQRLYYWEQVQRTHLKAPLEFVKLHFYLEGVTRSFTHQLVRQRTAVYAQESLRFAVKGNVMGETRLPESIQLGSPEWYLWAAAVEHVEGAYHELIERGIPAEDARGLLPHNITTRINYCTDLRNLLDHAGNRLCTQAAFEWREVFNGIVDAIRGHDGVHSYWDEMSSEEVHPHAWQFELIAKDSMFKPVCYQLGHCPFTADFDRGCTIRDRVQAGDWDSISDSEWQLDPEAGQVKEEA